MKTFAPLPLVCLFICGVEAANDWSQPCLSGSCSFDVARTNKSMAATLSINGSSSAVSDITEAAGWSILNCTTNTNSQTIQLVCVDESKGCNHLFQDGAENTIVRLPADCGAGPFVRVAKHTIPANQSLPTDVASKVRRSDGTSPQVHLLQIDGNFTEGASSGRTVDFSLVASTNLTVPNPNSVQFAGSPSGSVPIDSQDSATLFSGSLPCLTNGGSEIEELSMACTVDADTNLNIGYTFNVAGSVSPPSASVDVTTTIDGTIDVTLIANAQLVGTPSTIETVDLSGVDMPELDIADVFTIAPLFGLTVSPLEATYEFPVDFTVDVHYQLDGFSSTLGADPVSNAGFIPLNTHLQFSANPNVEADTSFIASVSPVVTYEISAFGQTGSLNIELGGELRADFDVLEISPEIGTEFCVTIIEPFQFSAVVLGPGNLFSNGDIEGSFSQDILDDSETVLLIYDNCFTPSSTGGVPVNDVVSSPLNLTTRRRKAKRQPSTKRVSLSCPSETISDFSASVTTEVSGSDEPE